MGRAHLESQDSDSLLKLGRCGIPGCMCRQYLEGIGKIDEDLV